MSDNKPAKASKRRRVAKACVYCQRSHLMCDSDRPCARCLRRNIAHLCRDEEEDIHTLYRKMRTEIHAFQAALKERGIFPRSPSDVASNSQPQASGLGEDDFINLPVEEQHKLLLLQQQQISQQKTLMMEKKDAPVYVCGMMGLGGSLREQSRSFRIPEEGTSDFPKDTPELTVNERYPLKNYESSFRLSNYIKDSFSSQGIRIDDPRYTATAGAENPEEKAGIDSMMGEKDFYTRVEGVITQLETLVKPVTNRMIETVTLMDDDELLSLTQSFERTLLSQRKLITQLNLPSVLFLSSSKMWFMSDILHEMLGYKREEFICDWSLLKLLPFNDMVNFIAQVCVPLHDSKIPATTIVKDFSLLKKDGTKMLTRATFTATIGSHQLASCIMATFYPYEDPFKHINVPACKVIDRTFKPTPPPEPHPTVLQDHGEFGFNNSNFSL